MTLVQLFLIHRYRAGSLHYLTPSEDNQSQTQRMQELGIFTVVRTEIGHIIVADVDRARVARADPARRGEARGADPEAGPAAGLTPERVDPAKRIAGADPAAPIRRLGTSAAQRVTASPGG